MSFRPGHVRLLAAISTDSLQLDHIESSEWVTE